MNNNLEKEIKKIELRIQKYKDIFEESKNLYERTRFEHVKVTCELLCTNTQDLIHELEWVLKLLK